jgi:hypothetical protein
MKNMILAALILVSTAIANAQENVTAPALKATVLKIVKADVNSPLNGASFAYVTLDRAQKTITLSATIKARCHPGMAACPQNIRLFKVTLPIVSISTPGCGGRLYVATEDQRPVDGIKQEISLIDSTEAMACHVNNFLNHSATELTYTTESYTRTGIGKSEANLIGEALKTIAPEKLQ